MRDDNFLMQRINNIWMLLFNEIPRMNSVIIKFKGKSRNKFGYIRKEGDDTFIGINELFKFEIVPEYIIDLTIAHELSHYAHGFNSPLEKKYKHPHKDGVVTKELEKRGFDKMIKKEKMFFKNEWQKIYEQIVKFKNQY